MNEQLSYLIVLTLVFVLVVITIIRTVRARKKAAVENLGRLGFFEIPGSDRSLLLELRGLVPSQRQQLPVATVYRRSGGFTDMYAFYPDVANGSSTTIAVKMPHLDLPLFRLFGRINVKGTLGGLLNELVLRAVGKGLARSEWPSDPTLGERYFLYAEDPIRVERFLVKSWGSLLHAEKDRITIFGKGDLLAFSRTETAQETRRNRATGGIDDHFAAFLQRVESFSRSIQLDSWERVGDHTVA